MTINSVNTPVYYMYLFSVVKYVAVTLHSFLAGVMNNFFFNKHFSIFVFARNLKWKHGDIKHSFEISLKFLLQK